MTMRRIEDRWLVASVMARVVASPEERADEFWDTCMWFEEAVKRLGPTGPTDVVMLRLADGRWIAATKVNLVGGKCSCCPDDTWGWADVVEMRLVRLAPPREP